MKIYSFNVRGLGGAVKKNKIRKLVRDEEHDFMAIQETKLEDISSSLCRRLWGGSDFDFCFLASSGNSGGILSIWNTKKASLVFNFKGPGFIGVCLNWSEDNRRCFVVIIYSQGGANDKRLLWETLIMSKNGFGDGDWCVAGDFNVVRFPCERRGIADAYASDGAVQNQEFNLFIDGTLLHDLPLLGQQFTWIRANGTAVSRLDRFLVRFVS